MVGVGLFTIDPWLFAVKFDAHWHIHVSNGEGNAPLLARSDAGAHILGRIGLPQPGVILSQVELMIVGKKAAVENDRQIASPYHSGGAEWIGCREANQRI